MTDQPPPFPEVELPSRGILRNLSLVWLVPLLALIVALGIAWQAYSERGTLIEIRFENAAGVEAGETTIRYRDVVIGTVEDVSFSEDLRSVIVAARIDNVVLPFLDEDATFWVVRPEISTQGVSGLSTVVSGVYIEGAWNNQAGTTQYVFTGREEPLFVRPGDEGRLLTLRVPAGMQLQGGAPVSFRGIQVGRLENPQLSPDAQELSVDVFIEAPHDARISSATRFWDTSGFSISLGAEGLSLDVESLASLVTGGLEFDDVFEGGEPVAADRIFDVYVTEEMARASAFSDGPIGNVPLSVQFTRLIRGLAPGTRVVMNNNVVGQITEVGVRRVETPKGPATRMVADLTVDAVRLGLDADATAEDVYDFFEEQIADGLRARVNSSGILTSEPRIELAVDYTASNNVTLNRDATPYPVIPWVPAPASSGNVTAEGVLERIAELPFEALLEQTIDTLASIEGLAGDPSLRDVPEEAIGLLEDARGLIGGDIAQAVPGEALAALGDLRRLLAEFNENNIADGLASVIAQVDGAMGPISAASERLPDLMANLSTLAETAAALELEATITSANSVLAGVDAFLAAEGMDEVPGNLASALTELEALTTQLRETDVVGSLDATLDATNAAAAELPGLVARTETVLGQVTALLGSYGARSDFMGETLAVLDEITTAARAIARLARTIERNPSSLISGR